MDLVLKTGWTQVEKEQRERGNIFTAMGMGANHWYRCANGHLYTVGDCGGLNESSTCPDCQVRIGRGSNTSHFPAGADEEVRALTASVVTVPTPDFTFGESEAGGSQRRQS